MPYPNEHAARVAEPLPQNSAIFARKLIAPGIGLILQKHRGDTNAPMKTQAYRFAKHQFTPEEAKSWLKDHHIRYVSFEPANQPENKETRDEIVQRITKELSNNIIESRGKGQGVGNPKQGDGGTDICVCPECKEEVKHERGVPCNEIKCPKCGASMVGKPSQEEKKESIKKITEKLSKAIIR